MRFWDLKIIPNIFAGGALPAFPVGPTLMSLVIHFSVIMSPSLHPSGFWSVIPSLLCHYVFLQAPGCSPLTSHITAMLRGCLRADRCCIHALLSPQTQKKPSSFSLSCMSLPLVCTRHSCQRMDHFQILGCHTVCPKTKKKGVVWTVIQFIGWIWRIHTHVHQVDTLTYNLEECWEDRYWAE